MVGSTSMAAGVLVRGSAAAAAGILGAAWPPSSSEEVGDGGTISRTERRRGGEASAAGGASLSSVSMLVASSSAGGGMEEARRGVRYVICRRGKKAELPAAAPSLAPVFMCCVCALCMSFESGLDVELWPPSPFRLSASSSMLLRFLPSPLFATPRFTLTHSQHRQQGRLLLLVILHLVAMASAPSTKQSATKKVRLKTRGWGKGVGRSMARKRGGG